MLKISNLTAGYGNGPDIIKNVNFEVKDAEIVTIIGPNGAGKSTVLRSIFGLTSIRSGEILFFGENLTNDPLKNMVSSRNLHTSSEKRELATKTYQKKIRRGAMRVLQPKCANCSSKHVFQRVTSLKTEHIIQLGISYVLQGRSVFPSMTVQENLEMGAFILKDTQMLQHQLAEVYQQFPRLYEKRHMVTRSLSGGEQQMVALGRALMLSPKLLLLDEPSIGLSPKITQEVFEKCLEIKKNGTSILMVEQNANVALEYSDRGYVLELGENRFEDSGKNLLYNKKVGELYLGKS